MVTSFEAIFSMGRTLELSHVSNKKVYVTCFGLRLVANVLGPGKQ